MKHTFRLNTKDTVRVDLYMLTAVIFLTVFGFIMIFSASSYVCATSSLYEYDMFYLVRKQIIWSLVGIAVMLFLSRVDYHLWAWFAGLGYLAAIALILMLKIKSGPIHGITRDEATRWLQVGPLSFQVADAVKVAIILFLAWFICILGKKMQKWWAVILVWILGGIVAALVYKVSENLSTAIVVLGITVVMSFLAHRKNFIFIFAGILGFAVVFLYVQSVQANIPEPEEIMKLPFRTRRIIAWLDPFNENYVSGISYQIVQSLYAVGRGGLFGVGLGNSLQKMGGIPEAQNDMIFAIILEELGLFGAVLIMFLFAYLMYQIFVISQTAYDRFGRLLAAGVLIHVALQTVLNIAVTVNLIPNTGISLPFFSSGGTSAVFMYIELGFVMSVWRVQIRMKREELERQMQEVDRGAAEPPETSKKRLKTAKR